MAKRKIIVAVHGVGDQSLYATIQSVTRQFCQYYGVPGAIPLGRFHTVPESGSAGLFLPQVPPDPALPDYIGFAEVYWADIPRSVVTKGYTLEESKKWARTIVDSIRRNYPEDFKEKDYQAAKVILEQMIEAISVIEQLLFLAGKMGIFKFNLNEILNSYLGDVQIVAEYKDYSKAIVDKFSDLMAKISCNEEDEIYIVAHSEGTVVSFIALLNAMSSSASRKSAKWLKQVKGLMTIGSPIDKHLLLWPELWRDLKPSTLSGQTPKIPWLNYYDFGDPIGYWLKSSQSWMKRHGFDSFDIRDFGYYRYYLPGKAHVDYWDDEYIFGQFISQVVDPYTGRDATATAANAMKADSAKDASGKLAEAGGAKPDKETVEYLAKIAKAKKFSKDPPNLYRAHIISYWVSYGIVFLLLFIGVFVLYKNVDNIIGSAKALPPISGATLKQGVDSASGVQRGIPPMTFLKNALGLAALLMGMTASARILCLTRQIKFFWIGPVAFLAGAWAYSLLVSAGFRAALGNLFIVDKADSGVKLAAVIALSGALNGIRHPRWGIRAFIVLAAVAVIGTVVSLVETDGHGGAIWPVVPATAAFLYLWWLAAIFFDLVFVWHLYVRHSQLLTSLQAFKTKKINRRNEALKSDPEFAKRQH